MNLFPIGVPRYEAELYAHVQSLLELQVRAYQKHYHLGNDTSVSVELAQELILSTSYCMAKTNVLPGEKDLPGILGRGQTAAQNLYQQVAPMAGLVRATMPDYASDFYRETLAAWERFLEEYDPLFFAHRVPAFLDYPLLEPVSEFLQGMEYAQLWLRSLWWENQILDAFPEEGVVTVLEASAPDFWGTPLNMAEQPLINGLGRCLLGLPARELTLEDIHRQELLALLGGKTGREIRLLLEDAMERLWEELGVQDPAAKKYAKAVIPQVLPRLRAALPTGELEHIFVG